MSISIIQDPMDPSSVKVFDRPLDIYDPRLNTLPHDKTMTWQGWINILKSLYTRANKANHPEFFNAYNGTTEVKIYDKMWSLVPDEDLWFMAYLCFSGSYNKKPYCYFYLTYGTQVDNDKTRTAMAEKFIEYQETYLSDDWSEEFLNDFYKMKEAFRLYVTDTVLNTKVTPNSSFGNNHHVAYLAKMLTNQRYITDESVGDIVNAKEFLVLNRGDSAPVYNRGDSTMLMPAFKKIVTKTWRDPLYRVHPYSANPLNILPFPLVSKGEHNPPLFGVELEVSTNYDVRTIIDAGHEPFMLAKQDSSIRGNKKHPMELVTVPMSMKAHKKEWAHWFSKLDYLEFDCTTDTSNGMHVHIDRKAFSSRDHINALCWFVTCPAHKDFMLLLSERTATSMQQWAPSPVYASSHSDLQRYRKAYDYCATTRGAVNLGKKATVEIRIFRGIVSYASVLKNLEAVEAMFHFTHHRSYSQLTLRHFITWLKQQPLNKYQVLRKFLQINDIDNILYMADVKRVIGVATDPEAIVAALNKSGLPITSKLVTYLNKGRKRVYVLDKATGLLTCIVRNKGKVSFLDRQLEARYMRGHTQAA